jgi:hypothetical protein
MIKFVAAKYIDRDMMGDMDLEIEVSSLRPFDAEARVAAHDEDEDYPLSFEIEFNETMLADRDSLLLTLAHEMVHIKQFALGELRNYPKSVRHLGKMYRLKDGKIDISKYYDYTWEVEAYGAETALYEEWKSHNA